MIPKEFRNFPERADLNRLVEVEETVNQHHVTQPGAARGLIKHPAGGSWGSARAMRARKLTFYTGAPGKAPSLLTGLNSHPSGSWLTCHLAQKEQTFGQDLGSVKTDRLRSLQL